MQQIKTVISAIRKLKTWNIYLMDYFKLNAEPIHILRTGEEILFRPNTIDNGIIGEVIINNLYDPKGFEIKKDDIVVDIGAHIGIFSVYASSKGAIIYAYEPNKENFEYLKINLHLTTNKAYRLAISNKEGILKLYQNDNNNGMHSLYGKGEYESVDAITLNDAIIDNNLKKIDFLKIDCEGSEYDILTTLNIKFFSMIDKIVIELHRIKEEELMKFLINKKFEVYKQKNMLYCQRNK